MGVGAGFCMYDVVVNKFTYAISSPDEFLIEYGHRPSRVLRNSNFSSPDWIQRRHGRHDAKFCWVSSNHCREVAVLDFYNGLRHQLNFENLNFRVLVEFRVGLAPLCQISLR